MKLYRRRGELGSMLVVYLSSSSLILIFLFIFVVVFSACSVVGDKKTASDAERFAEPQIALDSLIDALKREDSAKLALIMGAEGLDILSSGDEALDRQRKNRFLQLYEIGHRLESPTENEMNLLIGEKEWPFPIPLVKDHLGWYFDGVSGREEILNRVIGGNELNAISFLRVVPELQRQYASKDRDGDGSLEYAARFLSSAGKKDGLYWEVGEEEELSPLGPLARQLEDAGVDISGEGGAQPFHGYYFRIHLFDAHAVRKKVGNSPAYLLLAYPASYGESGIMSFTTTPDGKIFEQDLGEDTVERAKQIKGIWLDGNWSRIE